MPKHQRKRFYKLNCIILSAFLCTSCATSVGMTASAVTSATIAVGAAVVKAPFKLAGIVTDDDEVEQDSGQEND